MPLERWEPCAVRPELAHRALIGPHVLQYEPELMPHTVGIVAERLLTHEFFVPSHAESFAMYAQVVPEGIEVRGVVGNVREWERAGFTGEARATARDRESYVFHSQAVDFGDPRQSVNMARGVTRTLHTLTGILRRGDVPLWHTLRLRAEPAAWFLDATSPLILTGWVQTAPDAPRTVVGMAESIREAAGQ